MCTEGSPDAANRAFMKPFGKEMLHPLTLPAPLLQNRMLSPPTNQICISYNPRNATIYLEFTMQNSPDHTMCVCVPPLLSQVLGTITSDWPEWLIIRFDSQMRRETPHHQQS